MTGPPNRLVYLLDHEYTPRGLTWRRLKGADARRVNLLRTAAGQAGCETVLALADIRTSHSAFPAHEGYGYRGWSDEDDDDYSGGDGHYDVHELIDSEVTLTHWTGPEGTRLEETSLHVDSKEVCASTPTGALAPYSSEYEGYMGNWGNTLDRWYHRARSSYGLPSRPSRTAQNMDRRQGRGRGRKDRRPRFRLLNAASVPG
jgi:hypothetical protein